MLYHLLLIVVRHAPLYLQRKKTIPFTSDQLQIAGNIRLQRFFLPNFMSI